MLWMSTPVQKQIPYFFPHPIMQVALVVAISLLLGYGQGQAQKFMDDCRDYIGTDDPVECYEQMKNFRP